MTRLWTRCRFASPRQFATASCAALVAAICLDKIGPRGRFDDFFVGVLFGLGIGLGIFALAAYGRRRG